MTDPAPRNDLERDLDAAQRGLLEAEIFLLKLLDAQVFMPVKDDLAPGGIQRSAHGQPLVVRDDQGRAALVLFSSPERAKAFLAHYEGYGGGLLVDFRWVLARMQAGFGILLNPGESLGMDLDAELVETLVANSTDARGNSMNERSSARHWTWLKLAVISRHHSRCLP